MVVGGQVFQQTVGSCFDSIYANELEIKDTTD
jgi:hypothetical protein